MEIWRISIGVNITFGKWWISIGVNITTLVTSSRGADVTSTSVMLFCIYNLLYYFSTTPASPIISRLR